MTENIPTDRTRVKRMPKRGAYDAETINAILDAQPFCTVGYIFNGTPFVTPTMQWREGNHIYWHGSSASRALEESVDADVCVNVTLIDGMVMARSAFNHSVNYRSVMAFGKAYKITDATEKEQKMKNFVDALYPGRWDMLRPMTPQEFKATLIVGLELNETSAKIRNAGPGDDEDDFALPIWAGVIPVKTQILPPVDCARLPQGLTPPEHVKNFKIG